MATLFWPSLPVPASVSAPAYVDPRLTFQTDSGYAVRRPRTSRPRRRYALSYLGRRTDELRALTDVVLMARLGAFPIGFVHPTASDTVTMHDLTPIWLTYTSAHGLFTGFWIWLVSATPPTALDGQGFRVTRQNATQVTLDGTVSQGANRPALIRPYLPYATLVLPDETWPEPMKLLGPEQGTAGRFNLNVVLQEEF